MDSPIAILMYHSSGACDVVEKTMSDLLGKFMSFLELKNVGFV